MFEEIEKIDDLSDCLVCWFSELNYYLTKYVCSSLQELDDCLWYEYGVMLIVR